jgi:hypothetical protein
MRPEKLPIRRKPLLALRASDPPRFTMTALAALSALT